MQNKIDQDSVRDLYNNMEIIWPENDKWYSYTHNQIYNFLKRYEKILKIDNTTLILNAGSAGYDYGLSGNHIHIDIAEKHLINIPNSVIGSIENIPYDDNIFDICICVGAVINYCDAVAAISEMKRVLKPNGYLILDFDQSKSFEFIGTNTFNKNIDLINTFNSGHEDKTWVYSEKYISTILNENDFKLIEKVYYHNISPLIYKISKDEIFSSKFIWLDKIVHILPLLKTISCNIILIAQSI